DREVAFKQLLLNQRAANLELTRAATITLGERFLREARITAQLDHPSIIPVYEIAERDDGNIFYTMKFVRGLNIGKHIKAINNDKSLNDDQRLAKRLGLLGHFVDACNALAYAHSKDVLHRDIKPENIMLGKYGETFLVDWGLAKVLGEDEAIEQRVRESGTVFVEDLGPAHLTQDGAIFGTPAYLSPEQARGRHDEISNLSDVYSMGAVLFEIVSGACPIPGQNLRETIFRAASGDHDNLAEVCPNAPDELVVIVERAMQNEAADRFQSPTELAAEVEAWREGAQVSIYQYSSLQLLRRFLSRHKGPLFAAGLMVLLTLGFFAFSAWQDAAEFEEAVDERRQALTQAKGVIEGKGTATLLESAKAEIARIKSQRDAHTSNQPVPLLEANENAQAMRSADLLDAAQAISDRLVLAERPIRNQHVELLDEEEVKAESALAQDLRFAAARLE
ncbi:MAG: serine/threonine protein kinase, partial [Planctomycetes bacterium]|nr:serine/threonine protein kinase [Planctomycetota bacterium]